MPGRPGFMLAPLSFAATALALLIVAPTARAVAPSVYTFASGHPLIRGAQVDAAGNLYVSERYSFSRILRFTPPSNVPTVFATGIVDPIDMVFDDAGNLFVADYDNAGAAGKIWRVTPGGVKTAFAAIANPASLTRDAAGNLYAGEYFNQKIDKITPAGVVSTYVSSVGAAGSRLTMLQMDSDGTLYAGMLNGTIYKIGPGGSPITTFNTSTASSVGFVRGPDNNWYASTYDNDEIWQITPDGVGTLFAGAHGIPGTVNGPLLSARFNYPSGLVFGGGVLYIIDYNSGVVRGIDFATPTLNSTWGRIKALYR